MKDKARMTNCSKSTHNPVPTLNFTSKDIIKFEQFEQI